MPRQLWVPLTLTFLAHGLAVSGRDGGESTGECWRMSNGCSTYGLYSSYLQLFTPACHRHDVCFRCGASRGVTRLQCDNAFYADMRAACGGAGLRRRRKRATCWQAVWMYYSGVRVFGWLFYTLAQDTGPECSAAWVDSCLPLLSADAFYRTSDGSNNTTTTTSSSNHNNTSNSSRSDGYSFITASTTDTNTAISTSDDYNASGSNNPTATSRGTSISDRHTSISSTGAPVHATAASATPTTPTASAITANNSGHSIIYSSITSGTFYDYGNSYSSSNP